MTRKLAISVFAISLSVFGCGDDDGPAKKDTGVAADAGKDAVTIKDTGVTGDVKPAGDTGAPDAGVDVKPDVSLDGKTDVTVVTDGGKDTPIAPDAPQTPDAPAADATAAADGSVD